MIIYPNHQHVLIHPNFWLIEDDGGTIRLGLT
jgi:hypothetical protein